MASIESKGMHKRVLEVRHSSDTHWVGDGFPVRTLFSYDAGAQELSPFLLLDYAAPPNFPPTRQRLGVGEHPHRGFETVTIVYAGEVEHRDSAGGGGKIGPGDVQWMTAASGLVHEELHGREFAQRGGPFEMVQLWVNLPAKHKLASPAYQALANASIPVVRLEGGGRARIIAGELQGAHGPARTFTPIQLWDLELYGQARLPATVGFTAALVVLQGRLSVDGTAIEGPALVRLDREGSEIVLEGEAGAKLLLLSGEPLNEPIVGHGPFVMNTIGEIRQAMTDYQSGRMGHLASH